MALSAALLGALPSCEDQRDLVERDPIELEVPTVTVDESKIVAGQTVYVPTYSEVRTYERQATQLATLLSLRNTDPENAIIITSVRYFDSEGQLVRDYVAQPFLLGPLATLSRTVPLHDVEGGAGSNFLVEWVAEADVVEPLIEAVMTSGGREGISFVTRGKVIASRR